MVLPLLLAVSLAPGFGSALRGIESAVSSPSPVRVAAHRASWSGVPENSRAGVAGAVADGIPYIEIDLRLSRDGRVFILHDETLDRTTDGKGPIAGRSAEELASVHLDNGEPLPTLADLHALARGRSVLLLDLKADAVEAAAAILLERGSLADAVFFVSDDRTLVSAGRARSRHPGLRVMAKAQGVYDLERVERLFGGTPEFIQNDLPSSDLVEAAKGRGAKVCASVEGADRIPGFRRLAAEVLAARGVDLLLTDQPAWLRNFLSTSSSSSR